MMITSTPIIVPISPLFTVPLPSDVLTAARSSPCRGQRLAFKSYPSLQRKVAGRRVWCRVFLEADFGDLPQGLFARHGEPATSCKARSISGLCSIPRAADHPVPLAPPE